ncbi:MAG: cellulase-like family protein [Planctomycetota bacterium]
MSECSSRLEHPWRNAWSTYLEPRDGLLEFLPKCRERGVKVGLATWFPNVSENRHKQIQGVDEFVRAWHETLAFLDASGLLDNVIYVDLLNEYPLWHGFEWLSLMLESLSAPHPDDLKGLSEEERCRHVDSHCYNPRQFDFYNTFASATIRKLKAAWPALDFFFSFTHSNSTPWDRMDLGAFAALDVHHWFTQNVEFSNRVGYFSDVHAAGDSDTGYERCQAKLLHEWPASQAELVTWMRGKLERVAAVGRRLGIPYGNTEGWGPIMWREHPLLDWSFVKEAGLVGARLGAELGFAFNCSSNFTHPQFRGLWDDIDWHREVTGIIKHGAAT